MTHPSCPSCRAGATRRAAALVAAFAALGFLAPAGLAQTGPIRIGVPSTFGSAASRVRQSRWLMTTTRAGGSSSAA